MLKSTLTAAALAFMLAGPAVADDDDWRRRGHDRDDRRDHRHDDRRGDWRRDRDRDHDWRRHDYHRRHGDWRRHDNWRLAPWREHRRWRHVPPVRYRADFGYRSAYELAWRDWHHHGRHDRRWRRSPRFGVSLAYHAGYEAGWRDAASYYGHGYRPGYWAYDPRDGWYFGFHISG